MRGKVAIVTGATGGFGQAATKVLARAGAKIMLTGRSAETLAPVAKEIVDASYTAAYCAGDPVSQADNQRIVSQTVETFGGIEEGICEG